MGLTSLTRVLRELKYRASYGEGSDQDGAGATDVLPLVFGSGERRVVSCAGLIMQRDVGDNPGPAAGHRFNLHVSI